jgi:alkane 1-monooxygenase
MIPSLWFRVMDPRLLALRHIDGRLERVNVDPARRDELWTRYGSAHRAEAAQA